MKAVLAAVAASLLVALPAQAFEARDFLNDTQLNLGLGFGNFTGDMGSLTATGISWNGRVGFNPSPYWGGELNYQGVHTSVGAIIPPTGSAIVGQAIVSNELTIDAKGGYPFQIVTGHSLMPYGFVGIGWAGVSSNTALTSVGLEGSNAFAVPIGAGVSYRLSDIFEVDGRFTYNILTGSRSTLAPSGDTWNVGFDVGAHFGGFGGGGSSAAPPMTH